MTIEQWGFFSHTYSDTGHSFIMVISEDSWHSFTMSSLWQWSCHYLFNKLRSVAARIRTHNLPVAGWTLTTWLQRHITKEHKKCKLSVNQLHFNLLGCIYFAAFNQAWHIIFLVEWMSFLSKWWVTTLSKGWYAL